MLCFYMGLKSYVLHYCHFPFRKNKERQGKKNYITSAYRNKYNVYIFL